MAPMVWRLSLEKKIRIPAVFCVVILCAGTARAQDDAKSIEAPPARKSASARPATVASASGRASSPVRGPGSSSARPRNMRKLGWLFLGSSAALLISGAILGSQAAKIAGELEDASDKGGEDFADHKSLEALGKALDSGQIVTLSIGGVLAVAGAVLWILDHRSQATSARRAWLVPGLAPTGAVLTGGVRF